VAERAPEQASPVVADQLAAAGGATSAAEQARQVVRVPQQRGQLLRALADLGSRLGADDEHVRVVAEAELRADVRQAVARPVGAGRREDVAQAVLELALSQPPQ